MSEDVLASTALICRSCDCGRMVLHPLDEPLPPMICTLCEQPVVPCETAEAHAAYARARQRWIDNRLGAPIPNMRSAG